MTREEIKEMIDKTLAERINENKKNMEEIEQTINEEAQITAGDIMKTYSITGVITIIHDLIAMIIDDIDYHDLRKILDGFKGTSTIDVAAWTFAYYTRSAPKSERLCGSQIARSLYYGLSHEEYIEFFNEVQNWTKKALNEMGENTDV